MSRDQEMLREIKFTRNFTCFAEGSVLAEFGRTKVLCNATVEEKVPPFLKDTGKGWVTAEYSMLPRATEIRTTRGVSRGRLDGRSTEIQRLIGRSLRAGMDLMKLPEKTIIVDCDVIQADGGTRTTAISGGFVAMYDAVRKLISSGKLDHDPVREFLAAVSVGIVRGVPVLDLCYSQDFQAHVDMNVVMTESGRFIEVQGTAEQDPFSPEQLQELLSLAGKGIQEIIIRQKEAMDL